MISRRNSAALFIWPVAWIVSVWSFPYSTPVGSMTLLLRIAFATCDTPMLRAASCVGIELHAHRVLRRAEHVHRRHAFDHRQPLRDRRLRVLVDLRHRQHVRRQRDGQDRRRVRILLAVVRRQDRRRQERQRLADRRVHVLRRRLDVAVERELQRDVRAAECCCST